MAYIKTYRKNEQSLQAYETLRPLVKRIKWTIRGWWISIVYFWVVTILLFYFSKDHAHITAWVLILHALISLFVYFKNNKRNGRMFSTLKEYYEVQRVDLLNAPYKNLLNFTSLIIVLDAFLWPVIFPIKLVFWIFYRIFRYRMKVVKRSILEGGMVLIPEEDEIAEDPFYNFLMREGLYSAAVDIGEEDDFEKLLGGDDESSDGKDGKADDTSDLL